MILGAVILGLLFAIPNGLKEDVRDNLPNTFQRTINLGLDLQGGTHMLLAVDLSSVLNQALANERGTISSVLRNGEERLNTATAPRLVDDKIVVVSTFTPNQPFSLKLSKATSLFSNNSPSSLETAVIEICKGTNCELLDPGTSVSGSDDLGLNFTTRNFRPQIDVPYSLNVKVEGMEAFPNPTYGDVTLKFKAEAKPTTVRIMDVQGRLIFNETLNNFDGNYYRELDVSNGTTGVLTITILQDGKAFTKNIVLLARA